MKQIPVIFLPVIVVLLLPVVGYCNPFSDLFKNPKEVAVKVAELPEQYHINVHGLDFSLDGKQLAVDSADSTINIWDWQNERIVRTLEKPRSNSIFATEPIRYSPDGRLLVACHDRASGDIVARIWDTETWAVVHDIVDLNYGSCRAIGFTPDGKSLVLVSDRNPTKPGDNLIIYDTTSWQPVWGLRTVPFYTTALAISPDGKFVAIGGNVNNPARWPFSGQPPTPVPTFGNPPLPDQSLIAIVDLAQRTIIRTIENFDADRFVWSPDGAHLAAVGGEFTKTGGVRSWVKIIDAQTGKQVADETLEGISHSSLRYTPDGKYLIEGDMNGKGTGMGVRIWDVQHHELLQKISGNVGSLAVSRDGHYFAMGVDKKTVVWQLK